MMTFIHYIARFRLASLAVTLILASPSIATDGVSNSVCLKTFAAPDNTFWRIDGDLPGVLETSFPASTPSTVSYTDLATILEQTMQNLARQSRGRFRMRPLALSPPYDQCSALDGDLDACITSHPNTGPDGSNLCRDDRDSLAWSGCTLGAGCVLYFCSDNISQLAKQASLGSGQLAKVLAHEVGHNLGLAHVDTTSGAPNCTSSDGCDQELMCSATTLIRSAFLTHGDARGIRQRYGPSQDFQRRKVYAGSRAQGSGPIATLPLSTRLATHAPRIDCAGVSGADQCMAVIPSATGSTETTEVVALNGWTASGWGSITSITSVNAAHQFAPDIAVDPFGQEIFVATVSQLNNNAWVWFVDPSTGATFSRSLGYRAALPTRVFYDDDLSDAVVVGVAQVSGTPGQWRADRIHFNTTTHTWTVTPLTFGNLANPSNVAVASDFDVDCRTQLVGTSDCVLVSPLFMDGAGPNDVESGALFSRSFSINSSNVVTMPTTWARSSDAFFAQSVQGVALTNDRLVVSMGANPAGSHNSTTAEWTGLSVNPAPVLKLNHKSDAQSCSNPPSTGGFSLGAMTPHGGVSVSYCALCASSGRLQSMHYGRREDNDDFCF